jgi:hypothetical protein
MARVYVSSTYSDLMDCRMAVSAALRKLGHEDVVMEHYAADARRPLDRCLADIDTCDLYIGIFARRYGYIPPGQQRAITELEWLHARGKIDCLIFLLAENAPWPKDRIEIGAIHQIAAMREELKQHSGVAEFTGPLDLAAEVTTAVALWQTSTRTPREIQLAPPLPSHYIERPDVLTGITRELLDDRSGQPGVLVVSALHGLGGIGKTAAATAIAHDPAIRVHFRNGTLWATLGQNPDLLSHLTAWIHALGDPEYRPTTTIAATSYLRTLLYPTATLLIVDDAWEFEHVAPFVAGGPRCRLLVTTRRAGVADELGARVYSIAEMTPNEAVQLLRKRVETARGGRPLSAAELENAAALARDTGYLPLAVALMGGLVARGYPWMDARAALQREQTRTRVGSHAQTAVEASLQLSLDYLRKIDPAARENIAWLGVLADDVVINARMASTIWGMPPTAASRLLNALADDAIVQRNKLEFRVHDVMHDTLQSVLTADATDGVGMDLASAHRELLSRYGRTIPANRWDQLEDDGYIHSHLIWHFEQAGDIESIHALLRLTNEDGQHAWSVARDRLGQAAGFISDLKVAWRLVSDDAAFSLGEQCRCALVMASLHSLAQVITPKMVDMLVRQNIWLPAKALNYLRNSTDSHRRGAALLPLIPLLLERSTDADKGGTRDDLTHTLMEEVESAIAAGANSMLCARLLLAMAMQFGEPRCQRLLERAIAYTDGKPGTLRGLARDIRGLRDTLLQRAAENCYSIEDPFVRAESLIEVVADFPSPEMKAKWAHVVERMTEALFNATGESKPKHSARVAAKTAPKSPPMPERGPGLVQDDRGTAALLEIPVTPLHEHKHIDRRARLLEWLFDLKIVTSSDWFLRMANSLATDDRKHVIDHLRDQRRAGEANKDRAAGDARERFDSLLADRNSSDLDELVSLVPLLPDGHNQAVGDIMHAYGYLVGEEQGELLTRLAPYATESARRGVIEKVAKQCWRIPVGAQCLLANLDPEAERRKRFDEIVASLNSLPDVEPAMIALIRVAPPEVVHRAVRSLQRIDDTAEQVGAVFVVTPWLTDGLSAEMTAFLEHRSANRAQLVTLTRMVVELSDAMKGGVLIDFIREAARISSEWWIVEALTLTMLRLHDRARLTTILRAVKHITALDLKARLVQRLAVRMARLGYVEDAKDAAEMVPLVRDRWIILADLAADLATAGQTADAQKVVAAIAHPEERGKAAAEVALHVAARGQVQQARAIVEGISNELWRTWIEERLDLIHDERSIVVVPQKKTASVAFQSSEELDLESVQTLARDLLAQQPTCGELQAVRDAAASGDVQEAIRTIKNFWRAKFQDDRTYLEVIAEQPRPKLLKAFHEMAPLLTPALSSTDAERFVSAVREVATWWP